MFPISVLRFSLSASKNSLLWLVTLEGKPIVTVAFGAEKRTRIETQVVRDNMMKLQIEPHFQFLSTKKKKKKTAQGKIILFSVVQVPHLKVKNQHANIYGQSFKR